MNQQSEQDPEIIYELRTSWKDLHHPTLIGTMSAVYISENIVYHPFDVLRARIQTNQKAFHIKDTTQLIKRLGVRGMYAGFWPTTLGNLPGNAVYLLTYNFVRDKLQAIHESNKNTKTGEQGLWVSFFAGASADICSSLLYTPVEVVGQRLYIQDQKAKTYRNGRDAIIQIAKKDGIKGFYRGLGATLMTNVPASAIWWTSYEFWKEKLSNMIYQYRKPAVSADGKTVVNQHILAQSFAGLLAGTTMAFCTNPMDVIRTRLQTQDFLASNNQNSVPYFYKNSFEGIKSILKSEGILALQKGVVPRMTYAAFFSSFSGVIYEWIIAFSTIKKE